MHVMPTASIIPFAGKRPQLAKDSFVAGGAHVIGDVELGEAASIWFNTVVRGDVHYIRIGARTNIQDNCTLHVTGGAFPCVIGNEVTVGHNAVVHACTVEDLCLIGMGAVILDGAVIGRGSLVGAGALVTPGKRFPPGSMILGSPAKAVRLLTPEEQAGLVSSAQHYVDTVRAYATPG